MKVWASSSMENLLRFAQKVRREWYAYTAMVRKELTIMARYPVEFVASFGQVFLIVAIFSLGGRMFSEDQPVGSVGDVATVSTSGVVIFGFILYMFLSDTLWTIGYNIRHEQVQGTLEQLYLSPVNKLLNLIARVSNTLIWTGLLSVAAAILMSTMIGRLPFHNPLLGLLIFTLSLSGTFGIGFAFAALTIRVKETAQTVANFLQFGLMILCAHFFPFAALPEVVRFFSRLIPVSYCVDAFRSVMMGLPPGYPELAPLEVELLIISLYGTLMPILGFWLFRQAERYARKSGTLSAY